MLSMDETSSGSPAGVVLCHGFTGSPAAMQPWADQLAAVGHSVDVPLLPGHGTKWQDLNRTTWHDWFAALERSVLTMAERHEKVVIAGLSMGGCLALRAAQVHHNIVSALVLVNPVVSLRDARLWALPVLRHLTPSIQGISNDIARPGGDEIAYDRTPLHALHSQRKLWRIVRRDLPKVTQPILLFQSTTDHVLDGTSVAAIRRHVASERVEYMQLPNSYHVATLDYDAGTIFNMSEDFIKNVSDPQGAQHGGRPK